METVESGQISLVELLYPVFKSLKVDLVVGFNVITLVEFGEVISGESI